MMPSFTVLCPANELRLDSTGVILSPGYPDSYPNLQMCAWSISVEKGYNISMFVEFFQTEKEFDVLQVYDGNHGSYFLDIHKFSGNTLTVHINVQYKQLLMLLLSYRYCFNLVDSIHYENCCQSDNFYALQFKEIIKMLREIILYQVSLTDKEHWV